MTNVRFTLKKNEKLASKIATDLLFRSGNSFSEYPFRVVYALGNEKTRKPPVQVLVSVPKKKFKKAVDRNRIRRQILAAYRLQKPIFYTQIESLNKQLYIAIIYTSKKDESYAKMNAKIILSLQRLANIITTCEN